MGRVWMPGGGGSGDLDLVTATAGDVLKGKVIVGPDGEPLTGTLAMTGNAGDSQVLSGKTYYNTDAKARRTGSMANQGAKTASLNCGGSYTIPAGYHNGSGKVTANSLASQTDANAAAGDILSGKTAWVKGSKVTGSMAAQAGGTYKSTTVNQTISCSGKKMTGNVVIQGDSKLVAGNIKKGVTILGITGTWEGYVAAATDLYYMGQNPAGFSLNETTLLPSGRFSFDGAYITMCSGTINSNSIQLKASKSYNFTGYSNLVVTFRVAKKSNSPYERAVNFNDKTISNTKLNIPISSLTEGGDYTISLLLADFQKTFTPYMSFVTRDDTWQIKRIRLA